MFSRRYEQTIMSYFTIFPFRQYLTVNRCLIEQCLRQYRTCQTKLYVVATENRYRHYVGTKERGIHKKTLRTRLLQDLKQTRRKVEQIIERENIWTVPNFLCMGRIVTSPFLSYLILSHDYQVWFNILMKVYLIIFLIVSQLQSVTVDQQ